MTLAFKFQKDDIVMSAKPVILVRYHSCGIVVLGKAVVKWLWEGSGSGVSLCWPGWPGGWPGEARGDQGRVARGAGPQR